MRATVYVLDGGKVTIPKAIRDELDLESGDTVNIEVTLTDG